MSGIITLTTDFGVKDYYTGAMKAVILGIAPKVRLIDISHNIEPQDVMGGAWVVRNCAELFPDNTIHLVVVDPGVGTERNPVALRIGNQYYVGPDNGIFSLLTGEHDYDAVRLNKPEYWRDNSSETFHGRDIFAPVAAHLANDVPLDQLGEKIDELVTYRWASPIADKAGIQGWIVHIDRFGNLVSNIPEKLIREKVEGRSMKIYVGNTILHKIVKSYGFVEEGEPAAYIGSAGMLEIAINKGDASQMLSVRKGAQISIVLQS